MGSRDIDGGTSGRTSRAYERDGGAYHLVVAEFFEVVGGAVVALVVVFAIAVALLMRRLTRANRVAPGRRSAAPLIWLVSPGVPARLHRRLRRAVSATTMSAAMAPAAQALQDVAGELVSRAVTVDDYLVAAFALHPELRRPQLVRLSADVREIEGSAARLHQLSGDWRRSLDHAAAPAALPPSTLHERLDAVEATLRELPTAPTAADEALTPRSTTGRLTR